MTHFSRLLYAALLSLALIQIQGTRAQESTTEEPTTVASDATTVASDGSSTASPNCVDRLNPITGVSDCPNRAYLCENTVYYDLMTVQCPKTCNRCSAASATTVATTCVDLLNPTTGVSDCPNRAYLCNNTVYYDLMTQQCPKTCNRCS